MRKKANGAKKKKKKPARRRIGEVALVLRVPREAVAYIYEKRCSRKGTRRSGRCSRPSRATDFPTEPKGGGGRRPPSSLAPRLR